jgi:hypothetical protein
MFRTARSLTDFPHVVLTDMRVFSAVADTEVNGQDEDDIEDDIDDSPRNIDRTNRS